MENLVSIKKIANIAFQMIKKNSKDRLSLEECRERLSKLKLTNNDVNLKVKVINYIDDFDIKDIKLSESEEIEVDINAGTNNSKNDTLKSTFEINNIQISESEESEDNIDVDTNNMDIDTNNTNNMDVDTNSLENIINSSTETEINKLKDKLNIINNIISAIKMSGLENLLQTAEEEKSKYQNEIQRIQSNNN